MRIPRLYCPQPIAAETTAQLHADAVRHAVRVLRLREGAEVVLFDGSGREYPARLKHIGKGTVSVDVGRAVEHSVESPLDVTLVQGISRGERMDLTLQKATELGATRIVPVTMHRTVVRLSAERAAKRVAHWRGVVAHACQQCGRNALPPVADVVTFDAWLDGHRATDADLLLAPGAAPLEPGSPPASVTLVVGPEGGFAPQEVDRLAQRGFRGLGLGPRILRTETAALAALAVLQAAWGDLR
ncbi:MAG: 16S rRNA (uracil(1498)-N(3))-methyltransferase [Pseudomonadota bacterium]